MQLWSDFTSHYNCKGVNFDITQSLKLYEVLKVCIIYDTAALSHRWVCLDVSARLGLQILPHFWNSQKWVLHIQDDVNHSHPHWASGILCFTSRRFCVRFALCLTHGHCELRFSLLQVNFPDSGHLQQALALRGGSPVISLNRWKPTHPRCNTDALLIQTRLMLAFILMNRDEFGCVWFISACLWIVFLYQISKWLFLFFAKPHYFSQVKCYIYWWCRSCFLFCCNCIRSFTYQLLLSIMHKL